MENKVLFCATVDFHFKAFHLPYMKWFKEQGWEVHVAAAGNIELPYVDKKYDISIQRSPLQFKNIKAYKELKDIIDENQYKIIHCHTPMGGAVARLAARKSRKHGTKVLYTAHGFHFCKGAPLANWLLYYPIEKMLANYTDCLITINQEDYNLAVQRKFKVPKIEQIHGVGVDTEYFKPVSEAQKNCLRIEMGYKPDDFLMFYAAEFNKNKNQQFLIRSLALIKDHVPNARLLLAGNGPLINDCKNLAKQMGVFEMIDFLGYRNDIAKILPICDISVASSLREGLPVNIMEAMACGLPVIASENRGHKELIQNGVNGWTVGREDIQTMAEKIKYLAENSSLQGIFGESGREIIKNNYAVNKVLEEKSYIYTMFMSGTEALDWIVH
ncbi:glycosyltransferase family 4 protein [Bacillus mycoides]|uniref:Glycosyltransferase family 1 protein n=1 Tax=Bacillus mycoides TaxID=1405 RepID=A0A1S9T8Q5_BACMY|nr:MULTISPECIES: glycosyltransferase family 4 protein [Bacillus]MBJ8051840.1 glycosyltransferase family 4 protein [Bacillus cereus]MED0941475.1 glycosyltransferase family 4 protein [Bacillus mycoides]MED1009865.1 glycosyltransferase family 4 protein [Bacillus mycoides]MED1022201.1 glycosyltransferase family 4 protein [Bacillus mycoides]MED1041890.1 glycosyltransferase family 4 protein [Bacillus mycoides]